MKKGIIILFVLFSFTGIAQSQENMIIENKSNDYQSIKSDLLKIINFQLDRKNKSDGFNDILLWINDTNGYISCHYYNEQKKMAHENDLYSALELPDFFEIIITEENRLFNDEVLSILENIKREELNELNGIKIYYTSEINDPELLDL